MTILIPKICSKNSKSQNIHKIQKRPIKLKISHKTANPKKTSKNPKNIPLFNCLQLSADVLHNLPKFTQKTLVNKVSQISQVSKVNHFNQIIQVSQIGLTSQIFCKHICLAFGLVFKRSKHNVFDPFQNVKMWFQTPQ